VSGLSRVQAFEFLTRSGAFESEMSLDWLTRFNRMFDQGWIYYALKGPEVLAVGGAYRIPEWQPSYRHHVPRYETGTCLYIPFFACQSADRLLLLKFLRQFVNTHPELTQYIYESKRPRPHKKCLRILRPKLARPAESPGFFRRIRILPPELARVA